MIDPLRQSSTCRGRQPTCAAPSELEARSQSRTAAVALFSSITRRLVDAFQDRGVVCVRNMNINQGTVKLVTQYCTRVLYCKKQCHFPPDPVPMDIMSTIPDPEKK